MNANAIYLVEKAMKDEAFAKQLAEADSMEAAQKLFASRGIEFTMDEIKAIAAGLRATESNGELSAEDLEDVAGGVSLGTIAAVAKIVACGVKVVNFIGKRCGWWE